MGQRQPPVLTQLGRDNLDRNQDPMQEEAIEIAATQTKF